MTILTGTAQNNQNRRKAQKAQKDAERPETQKGAERDFFRAIRPKNRCKARRLNRWLIMGVCSVPGLQRKLYIINKL